MTDWLPTLKTETPEAGVRDTLRPHYAHDAGALIVASHVVAAHFATVAAANDDWTSA